METPPITLKPTPEEPKHELSEPLISISLEYYLQLACRSFDGYATIPHGLADVIKKADPTEQHHHLEPYGNPLLTKLYPIDVWRRCYEKITKDRENSEKDRQLRFGKEEELEKYRAQIQRKRDIIAEANADVKKKFPNILVTLGRGLQTWNQQQEFFEYYLFRALNGENEKVREKFGLEKSTCEEFQLLPADPGWRNKYYQGERDLEL